MPFLFVDYDQGAGGEYLCKVLSQAPQCVPLDSFTSVNGSTKIKDVFNQELLKFYSDIKEIPEIPADKYTIVPTHRHSFEIKKQIPNSKFLRIHRPKLQGFWYYQKMQQLRKTIVAHEPTDAMFVGFVKLLAVTADDPHKFASKVSRDMDNLELILLSHNVANTKQNRQNFINYALRARLSEPKGDFDCTIAYEDLILNAEIIAQQIQTCLNITVDVELLKKYKQDYETFYKTS